MCLECLQRVYLGITIRVSPLNISPRIPNEISTIVSPEIAYRMTSGDSTRIHCENSVRISSGFPTVISHERYVSGDILGEVIFSKVIQKIDSGDIQS